MGRAHIKHRLSLREIARRQRSQDSETSGGRRLICVLILVLFFAITFLAGMVQIGRYLRSKKRFDEQYHLVDATIIDYKEQPYPCASLSGCLCPGNATMETIHCQDALTDQRIGLCRDDSETSPCDSLRGCGFSCPNHQYRSCQVRVNNCTEIMIRLDYHYLKHRYQPWVTQQCGTTPLLACKDDFLISYQVGDKIEIQIENGHPNKPNILPKEWSDSEHLIFQIPLFLTLSIISFVIMVWTVCSKPDTGNH